MTPDKAAELIRTIIPSNGYPFPVSQCVVGTTDRQHGVGIDGETITINADGVCLTAIKTAILTLVDGTTDGPENTLKLAPEKEATDAPTE